MGFGVERTKKLEKFSYLYWFKNSSIEKNNIFIYSEENLPLNVTKNINETGFNYINLFNSKNDIVNPINIIKLYKQYFLNIDFFKNLEVSSIKFYLIWKIECYKKIFQKYNVKMLNQHQEFSFVGKCIFNRQEHENHRKIIGKP